jgi:hypothetical protein
MARGARNQKIKIDPKLDLEANDAIKKADTHFGNTDLSTLDAAILTYMPTTQAAYDTLKTSLLIKRVRHAYFHMSAKDEIGLKPRFKDGIRWRQPYGG